MANYNVVFIHMLMYVILTLPELLTASEDFHIKSLFVVSICFEKVRTTSRKLVGHVASRLHL